MKNKNKKKYAVACVTSMGLRITPENRMAVHNSNRFLLQATSAESNVLNVTSSLGRECLALTRFVEGSPMAAFIKAQLRARNIAYEAKEVPQGGPWGYRHQFNIADSGFGLRAPRVWNDRAGEVGRTLDPKDYDVKRIFGEEGVEILHLSGLIAAMSPETTKCCLAIAKAAKKYGTLVSFDLNYRATFWKGREAELRKAFHQIARVADILVGNEEDFQLCLGFKGPEAGGKDLAAKIESFKAMITQVVKKYPNAKMCGTTLRQVITANDLLRRQVVRRGAASDRGDGSHRRRRRLHGRTPLRRAQRLGRREVPPVRLGERRPRGVLPQRLRRTRRRKAGLGHLQGQRPRPEIVNR